MRTITIESIGEVSIRKSARAKRLILKIDSRGKPVVTIPNFVPYIIGEQHAKRNAKWLQEHMKDQTMPKLFQGMRVGTQHSLQFVYKTGASKVTSRVQADFIYITLPEGSVIADPEVQAAALSAITRAVKRQAQMTLPSELYTLAQQYGYSYASVSVKNMTTRWGSCSSQGVIALNIWLLQVPEELRRYVLCHELAHLNNPHHKPSFWNELSKMDPSYKTNRTKLKAFQPKFQPYT